MSVQDSLALVLHDLDNRIESHPSDADLFQQRAKYYLVDRQYEKALTDIGKAISLAPKQPSCYIILSDVYLGMGKPDNSNDALLKAISVDPRNNPALIRLAKLSLIMKDYKSTFEYVKKALDVESINPQAYFTRALAYLEKGDTATAVEDLKKTTELDQKYYDAYVELGELYALRKDPVAVDYFKNAIRLRPQSTEALYNLGMFYQETGRYTDALRTYDTLAKADSSFKDAYFNRGYIYLVYLGDYSNAIGYFSGALQKDPGYVEALFNRGYAYELSGKYSQAAKDYKHVLELRTNYQKAIDGLNRLDKVKGRE